MRSRADSLGGDVFPKSIDGVKALGVIVVMGFGASAKGFTSQPEILDSASRLFVDVLGDRGVHARAAFSVEQLPPNTAIELSGCTRSQRKRQ